MVFPLQCSFNWQKHSVERNLANINKISFFNFLKLLYSQERLFFITSTPALKDHFSRIPGLTVHVLTFGTEMTRTLYCPIWLTVKQIRRVFEDNLGIIFVISPSKHILWVLIRIASPSHVSRNTLLICSTDLPDRNACMTDQCKIETSYIGVGWKMTPLARWLLMSQACHMSFYLQTLSCQC